MKLLWYSNGVEFDFQISISQVIGRPITLCSTYSLQEVFDEQKNDIKHKLLLIVIYKKRRFEIVNYFDASKIKRNFNF